MKILMFSNTYVPHVSGVAQSVRAFAHEFRRRGHEVLIVAPDFQGVPATEAGVIRVPAIQNFNGSDFSVRVPIPGYLQTALGDFSPDLVHSHHPFLLGDAALRIAAEHDVPVVFQHHTMYERCTHYVPGDSPTLQQFVVLMSTEYANLCDHVLAPSQSVRALLSERGVEVSIDVVPTGVDIAKFSHGDGQRLRSELSIPRGAFVVGYLGRLAPEKNLTFLAESVARFLQRHPNACFLVVGDGSSREELCRLFSRFGLGDRLYLAGTRGGREVVNAYHAMDVFAFASQSETQGMVLVEAMAAGCPVVGVDAPGVREVVEDGNNGRLLPSEQVDQFAASLAWVADRKTSDYSALCAAAQATAERFSMSSCTEKALSIYRSLVQPAGGGKLAGGDWEPPWQAILRRVETEWELFSGRLQAAGKAVLGADNTT